MHGMTEILKKTADGVKPYRQIDDGEQWLADLVAKSKKLGVISEVSAISPSRAHALLARNPDNRNISNNLVNTFSQDILAGRWTFNGEPIIISDNGLLNDGQHRCSAVITAGKTIEVLIVVGVPRKSRMTTDMGAARTVGHFIGMTGVSNPNNVASVASILLAFEDGAVMASKDRIGKHTRATKAQVLRYARLNLDEIQKALGDIDQKAAQRIGSYSRLAAALVIIARHCKSWAAAKEFICAVVDGADLIKRSPQHLARERLLSEKQGRSLTPYKTLEIIFRSWNAHRTKTSLSRLQVMGQWPEIAR